MDKGTSPDYTINIKWTKNKKNKMLKELIAWVEYIVWDDKQYGIPDEPHITTPQISFVLVLGTHTKEFDGLNEECEEEEEHTKLARDKLRNEKEARGERSMYSTMQNTFPPALVPMRE